MPAPRVLLVEDDPALAELLDHRFRAEGYIVDATPDGDEALLLASEHAPDLVILDWMIEGTSGIEVCRRLHREKATAHVPIIMLSAREAEITRPQIADIDVGDSGAKLTVAAWARNLFNEGHVFYKSGSARAGVSGFFNDPRTFGFEINIKM